MLVYAGPFPETSQSNTHVLLVTDYFTKWVEAAPLQKKDPLSVAKALATVFYRWAFLLLVTLHLCSELWHAGMCVAKMLNVHKSRNPPSTGDTMQHLSVVLYKELGKSLLSCCYQGRGGRGRGGSPSSPKAKRAGAPLFCRSFNTIP